MAAWVLSIFLIQSFVFISLQKKSKVKPLRSNHHFGPVWNIYNNTAVCRSRYPWWLAPDFFLEKLYYCIVSQVVQSFIRIVVDWNVPKWFC